MANKVIKRKKKYFKGGPTDNQPDYTGMGIGFMNKRNSVNQRTVGIATFDADDVNNEIQLEYNRLKDKYKGVKIAGRPNGYTDEDLMYRAQGLVNQANKSTSQKVKEIAVNLGLALLPELAIGKGLPVVGKLLSKKNPLLSNKIITEVEQSIIEPMVAAQAKADRMLSQSSKFPKGLETVNKNTYNNIENQFLVDKAAKWGKSPESLGLKRSGVGDYAILFEDAPITKSQQKYIANHEVDHLYEGTTKESNDWLSAFDNSKLSKYLKGRPVYRGATPTPGKIQLNKGTIATSGNANEIRARAGQIKDFIAMKKGIPLSENYIMTQKELDYGIKNFVKETGLDNNMSQLFNAIKDKKTLLSTINKYALGTTGTIVGASINNKENKALGGKINNFAMGGINRYDVPAQDNYRNTYVPLPYEQIMGTVAARQSQLQREQDMLNKTYEDTQNLRYIPGTKDEAYVRNYLGKTSDIVNKYYGQDLSDPIVKQQMRSEFNNITNKQDIQNIQDSWQNWMSNNKYKAQLKSQGNYHELLDEDPANKDWSTLESGNVYNYSTPAFKAHRPVAEQFFNNIDSSVFKDAEGNIKTTKEGYILAGRNKPITDKVINTKWTDFDNTYEGGQAVTIALKQQGLDYTDKKNREVVAKQLLQEVAPEFWVENIVGSRTPNNAGGRGGLLGGEFDNTHRPQNVRVKKDFNPFAVEEMNFDDSGSVKVNPKHETIPTQFGYGALHGQTIVTEEDTKAANDRKLQQKAQLDFVRKKIPALAGLSDKDTYQAYRDLIKDGAAYPDLPRLNLPSEVTAGIAQTLISGMTDRKVAVMDDKGSTELRDANDNTDGSAMKELGYNITSLKKGLKDGTITVGGLAQNGDLSGMYILEVPDIKKKNKGYNRKLYVSSDDTIKGEMSPLNEIYNNMQTFQEGVTPIRRDEQGNVEAVKVVPNAYRNPKTNKWEYEPKLIGGYIDEQGNFTPKNEVSIDGISEVILDGLINSGKLGTVINQALTPKGTNF